MHYRSSLPILSPPPLVTCDLYLNCVCDGDGAEPLAVPCTLGLPTSRASSRRHSALGPGERLPSEAIGGPEFFPEEMRL